MAQFPFSISRICRWAEIRKIRWPNNLPRQYIQSLILCFNTKSYPLSPLYWYLDVLATKGWSFGGPCGYIVKKLNFFGLFPPPHYYEA